MPARSRARRRRRPAGVEDRLAAARVAVEGERIVAAAAHQRIVARTRPPACRGRWCRSRCRRPCRPEGWRAREARGVEREVAGAGRQDRVLEAADGGDRGGHAPARESRRCVSVSVMFVRAVVHQPRIEPAGRQDIVAAAAGDRGVAGPAGDRVWPGARRR